LGIRADLEYAATAMRSAARGFIVFETVCDAGVPAAARSELTRDRYCGRIVSVRTRALRWCAGWPWPGDTISKFVRGGLSSACNIAARRR
jgi:hypothetical protein